MSPWHGKNHATGVRLKTRNRRQNMIKHKILEADELPEPGTAVAIDAEFVALQQVRQLRGTN